MTSPGKQVDVYFRQIGLKAPQRSAAFWKRVEKQYGPEAVAFGDAVERREAGEAIDPYPLKSVSRKFSIDVTSQYDSNRYRSYLKWFIAEDFGSPKRILDIGCDNGILTSFYAQQFPDAQVIGIDSCAKSLLIAESIASDLGLANVRFEKLRFGADRDEKIGQEFDLITASTVFHDVVDISVPDLYFNVDELSAPNSGDIDLLSRVGSLLSDKGTLISLDRIGRPSQFWRWAQILQSANLFIDLNSSFIIFFKGPDGESEKMPITVGRRAEAESQLNYDDIIGFFVYPDVHEKPKRFCFEGNVAEAMFRSFPTKQLLRRVEIDYKDGSGQERLELYLAGPLAVLFNSSNRGHRSLNLGANVFLR
jgi:SAM-dependent methyltransferase